MKALLLKLSGMDTEAEAALRVIAYFDALGARSATAEMIARGAAAIAECGAGFVSSGGPPVRFSPVGERLRADRVPARARQHTVGEVTAWIERSGDAEPLDDLILERFAMCARAALRDRQPDPFVGVIDQGAVEAALSMREPVAERSLALRRLGFTPNSTVVVLAVVATSSGATPAEGSVARQDEQLESLIARLGQSHRAKGATLGTLSAVIVQLSSSADAEREIDRVHEILSDRHDADEHLRIGIGGPHEALQAGLSWVESRSALRFARARSTVTPVVDSRQLGPLGALVNVDPAVWASDWRIRAMVQMDSTDSGRTDLAVLEEYLAVGSLRAAGQALHMHHSSVAARLARLEERLNLNFASPAHAFQARLCMIGLTLLENPDTFSRGEGPTAPPTP